MSSLVLEAARRGTEEARPGRPRVGPSLWRRAQAVAREYRLEMILYVLYVALTGSAALLRHATFGTGFDLVVFDQALWNTAHGRFLQSSVKGDVPILGDHFGPLAALFAPLFYIWDDARVLLLAQAAAVGTGLFSASALARRKLGGQGWGQLFAVAFFLYLPCRMMLTDDFHPDAFVDPLVLAAFACLAAQKASAFFICLGLAALAKENMNWLLVSSGLYLFLHGRMRRAAAAMALAGLALFCLEVFWWIPALGGRSYLYAGDYSQGVWGWADQLFSKESWTYLRRLLSPVAALPLVGWREWAMALPFLGQNLAARNWLFRRLGYHYTAALNAFLFIAAIEGARRVLARWPAPAVHRAVAVGLLACSVARSGLPEAREWRAWMAPGAVQRRFDPAVLRELPAGASLRINEKLAPHVAHREALHIFENDHPLEGKRALARDTAYIVLEEGLVQKYLEDRRHTGAPWSSPAAAYRALRRAGYREARRSGTLRIFKKAALP